jgi:hypothetical protein
LHLLPSNEGQRVRHPTIPRWQESRAILQAIQLVELEEVEK